MDLTRAAMDYVADSVCFGLDSVCFGLDAVCFGLNSAYIYAADRSPHRAQHELSGT